MEEQKSEPQEAPRTPVPDLPLSLVGQVDAEGAGDALAAAAGGQGGGQKGGGGSGVAGELPEPGEEAPQGASAEETRAPRAPKALHDMSPSELERHAKGMLAKAVALLSARLAELAAQGQACTDPMQVVEMLAKLKDMGRADYWDEKLGKVILEQRDPKLLAQGPAGPLLAKLQGKMQAVKKAKAGDGRTTPEKLRKEA